MSKFQTVRYRTKNATRAFRRWVIPYIQSRFRSSEFRPLLSYLFTEWKCNIDCHYCFDFNNKMKGMTLETAMKSIEWLKSVGCRVVAIMGGEPLLRKDFILKVVEYGSKNGFFVYLPTNGYLLTKDFIDNVGAAGVATINLAVDCISTRPGLPKALMNIEPQFRYLVKQQQKYGYLVFFNINITSKNLKDVKMLTEIAHENGIGTDYHINESPLIQHAHYKHMNNDFYIKKDQWGDADELLNWLIKKNKQGYTMVNSTTHFEAMKKFIRNQNEPWDCRAGRNGLLIKADGSLSPCFELQDSEHDWGRIWAPKFNQDQLKAMKKKCYKHCLSTCFFSMGHYYHSVSTALEWMVKHSMLGRAGKI